MEEIRKYEDYYTRLRDKIRRASTKQGKNKTISELIFLAPDLFHLMVKLLFSHEVAVADKLKIAGALAYFMSPIDLLPEAFLGIAGYADDIVVAALVINSMLKKYANLTQDHWAGESEILTVVGKILEQAEQLVGKRIWAILNGRFRGE
ncbi:MAG TPA: DUF1232 domain-containing protein [Candidatus Marinimicrobia bacterium]|nr:DUF1232 domain-containing protein [Candidatus Neomarinimicrobiota bacterium]